jgi:hypothetical protein
MNTEKMIIKATFELPGSVQIRQVTLGGYIQKVQILLGGRWHTFTDEEANPYVALFNQLVEFENLGVTTFLHVKADGLAGRIATMPNGDTAYFWRNNSRRDRTHWLKATEEQAMEIASYQEHVAALKAGDPIVVWIVTDVNTGEGTWTEGVYQYATPEGHWVLASNCTRLRTSFILTLDDAVTERAISAPLFA